MKNVVIAVGDVFETSSYGTCEVIEYNNSNDICVRFIETGTIAKCRAQALRNGQVRDLYVKTVHGIGYLGRGEFVPWDGEKTKEYVTWLNMLTRCYGSGGKTTQRRYDGCTVCTEWHNFQSFAAWCNTQPEFFFNFQSLDKDILVRGNREYSPNACSFVPRRLNTAVTGIKRNSTTGSAGAYKKDGHYNAQLCANSKRKCLGYFDTLEEATSTYKNAKIEYVRSVAEEFKSLISAEVYDKLCNWEVMGKHEVSYE